MPPKLIHRSSNAQSLASDNPVTPALTRSRRSAIGPTTASTSIEELSLPQQTPQKVPLKLEPHYTLPPTIPSPFTGTLEASLDAILAWSQRICPAVESVQRLVSTLLEAVNPDTNWPSLLEEIYTTPTIEPLHARDLVTELLFLVTRTLLPEQIVENRAALARLYETRKHTAIRFVLRYDMLREWSTGVLNMKTCFALLHWQWLRQNNEKLGDMEVHGWEELEGKAYECQWMVDDVKRYGTGISTNKNNIEKDG